jgi:hypothetical protein
MTKHVRFNTPSLLKIGVKATDNYGSKSIFHAVKKLLVVELYNKRGSGSRVNLIGQIDILPHCFPMKHSSNTSPSPTLIIIMKFNEKFAEIISELRYYYALLEVPYGVLLFAAVWSDYSPTIL